MLVHNLEGFTMKNKMFVLGTVLALGTLGSITAFAATSSGTSSTPTKAISSTSHFHRRFGKLTDVASILGIDEARLRSDLAAGQSLAQIANSKGISEDTLIADLKSDLQKKLDQAVKNGKLTTQQKQNILDKFNAHAAQLVERTGGFDKSSHGHHHDMDGNGTSSDSNA
jgi:hypothetical protein